jgi:thiamine biosynthesis lipoprotein
MQSNASSQISTFTTEVFRVKKKRPLKWLGFGIVLFAVILAGLFATRQYNLYRFHLEKQIRFMMDTYVTVYAIGSKAKTLPAINAAMDRMQAVDAKFNSRNPESPVYAFNVQNVPITDREILDVVTLALQIAKDTDGAFDITVEPLIELWRFYGDSPRLPGPEEIQNCLKQVGYSNLVLSDTELHKKRADVRIDLGAIAKGYAVGQAAKVLRDQGVTSALIDAGGDVYALGKKAGELWKVGIRKPRGDEILGYLEIQDLAVMGSGDYERFFMRDGKRYHHIFDPKTGYPAAGLSGTTLVHPDPMVADAWNTAIFVLGPEKGLDLVERIPGMEALMVTTSGKVIYSSGLAHALKAID